MNSSSRILTALVSYNRLGLLQRTVASYLDTVTGPHKLLVVDNASDTETREWLQSSDLDVLYLDQNRYPGYAANLGWEQLLKNRRSPDILLHRSDNDVEYQPGWCHEVRQRFHYEADLAQLGLRTLEEEGPHNAVGGNCVLRRQVWEHGYRYTGQPWPECPFEDADLSSRLTGNGWRWDRVQQPCITHIGTNYTDDPDYYRATFRARGINPADWGIAFA